MRTYSLFALRIYQLRIECKDWSSMVIEAIGTVLFLFFYFLFFCERYFKCKKHKQKHLSNIQPNVSTSKKHLSNIQTNISKLKLFKQKLLVTPCVKYLYASFF